MRSDKLLIYLKPKFLGDAVMATPALRVLASNYDEPTVLAPPHIQELLKEDSKGLTFLAPFPQEGLGTVLQEAKRLRKMRFDTVLLINRSIRSALIARLARIPHRVGHSTEYRGFLLTVRVPHNPRRFEAASYGDLVEAMGLSADFGHPSLTVTDGELKKGKELAVGSTVGVQPGARFEEKMLPRERLANVVRMIQDSGYKVVLIGGKDEVESAAEFSKLLKKPAVDLVGKCSLRESMGVVAGLRACIGASTGIMHIAAACGCPTVTVFGHTVPSRWGHNYAPHQSVQIRSHEMRDMDPEVVYQAFLKALEAYPAL